MSEGDLADRADSTVPGDQRRGGDDIQVLPAGLVRMSDPRVPMTARDGPPTVARPIAYRGRVTLFHAREKVGKSTLLRAAVAAVTRGTSMASSPTHSTQPGIVDQQVVDRHRLEAHVDVAFQARVDRLVGGCSSLRLCRKDFPLPPSEDTGLERRAAEHPADQH